jgi:hypothetical protein
MYIMAAEQRAKELEKRVQDIKQQTGAQKDQHCRS